MNKTKTEEVDRDVCPGCGGFIVFEKRGGSIKGRKPVIIGMDHRGYIVCECGFVISDMSDIHRKAPDRSGDQHWRRKRAAIV